ncbi:MAG TPA: FHA domain-containing protein [Actinomycetes bacterium]|nr:FHA domain-containing protein [Actinomycetes bacterium]
MTELTLTVIRLGFLAVLWAFVLTVAGVMRTDMFGQRVKQGSRGGGGRAAKAGPKPNTPKPPKAPKAKRGTARTLVVTAGSLQGTSVTLGATPLTIGRSADCTLVIDDDYASNHHARIYPHEQDWVVEDLGSTNGTYLQRTRVVAPTVVPLGVPVRIGKTVLELRK